MATAHTGDFLYMVLYRKLIISEGLPNDKFVMFKLTILLETGNS